VSSAATVRYETASEAETSAVGERVASAVVPGDVILLYGELGAGKTAFVRGLARGLGAAQDEVSSPTFTLIQEYSTRGGVLFHVDLYRLKPEEVDDLGLDELMGAGSVVAVEWPERWRDPPSNTHDVRIAHAGGDRRSITITNRSTG
jgi:tRNA threonylcarbamoyladenosine biosynthesis protein TsaE